MNYRQLFLEISQRLNKNEFINILNNDIGTQVPGNDRSYQMTLNHYKIILFEKLQEFYYSISSCNIEWQCDLNKHPEIKKFSPDDSLVSGQIIIRSLGYMLDFDKKLDADWWTKNLEEEEKADLLNFRYFDFNDDNIRVGFIMKNNIIKEEEFYFILQESTGFSPVDLSFDDYLLNWDKYKGYQGWQQNIFFNNSTNFKRMTHYIKQLFP